MKYFGWAIAAILGFIILGIVLSTCNTGMKMQQNLQQTVYDEFKPSELLRKYEWFKNASSQLDQKKSSLEVYKDRFVELKQSYQKDSLNRSKWSREDKEQWNIWQSEYAGLKASYNDLAAQYNSAMSKFNYRFCNKGELPAGESQILPREYREYLN